MIDFLLKSERTEERSKFVPIYPSKTRLVLPEKSIVIKIEVYKYYKYLELYSDDYYNEPREKYPFIDYNCWNYIVIVVVISLK